jgi:hypothetical protein
VELGINIAAGPISWSDRHDPGADAPRSIVDAHRADRLGVIEALRLLDSGGDLPPAGSESRLKD